MLSNKPPKNSEKAKLDKINTLQMVQFFHENYNFFRQCLIVRRKEEATRQSRLNCQFIVFWLC